MNRQLRIPALAWSLACIALMCLLCIPSHCVTFDFEDGTLQGWTVAFGDVGKQPVDNDDDRYGGNFNKQGRYFIGTYENLRDDAEAEFVSPTFTVSSKIITLLVGGGHHPGETYVALYRASDGAEIFRETGANSETMQRRFWDVSSLQGQQVYLKIVDRHRGGWGHINVDDIRELSSQEVAQIEAERREQQRANERWLERLTAPSERKVYRGRELVDIAMPMGGIGAGNIAVCGDGSLREWQIFNKMNSSCVVPGQMFAVWARAGDGKPVAKVLRTDPVGDLPLVDATEFIGEFPIAEVRYLDDELPVRVTMQAFSPFIPLNSRDSGIPGIYFVFTLSNPGREQVSVSVLGTLQNAVNYDGYAKVNGVRFAGYGGNTNTPLEVAGATGLLMSAPTVPKDARQFGTMALAALSSRGYLQAQFDSMSVLWADFSADGRIREGKQGPSGKGRTWNGAVAVPLTLSPGEERSVVFLITWHFPNYYADYDRNLAQYRLGRMYSNWFGDASEVARYMIANYDRLSRETHLFHDTFYSSSLPYWFLDRIGAPASTLTSQTCLWIEDGGFHAFEGAWCCPMNCTHVWNYEQTLAHLFPDLERSMRHTDLMIQMDDNGAVRHRTVLPLSLPRGTGPFVDGQLGTILKSYREFLMSADGQWLDEMWPRIRKAMDYVVNDWDRDQDGVLLCEQWNTYDAAMYGPNTFIGTLYLGALRAAEEMAKVQGDDRSASRYRSIFESGSRRLDSVLWNGEYYVHIDEKKDAEALKNASWLLDTWPEENPSPNVNRPYGTGCHADQLLGQWWAHILDLGYLLPKERISKTLDSIMQYDWRWDFGEVPQQRVFASKGDKGLLNCTWPKGGRPENATLYSDEVWTGIEYEVAGLLLREGKVREAYQIVKAISDRYNGVPNPPFKRNPWNEIECGEHYARAMSSWGVLLAAQGFSYRGPDGFIGFDPVINPSDHRSFFTAAEGWGTFDQKRDARSQIDRLTLAYGRLSLRTFVCHLPSGIEPASVIVKVSREAVKFDATLEGSALAIHFRNAVFLSPGKTLVVSVKW